MSTPVESSRHNLIAFASVTFGAWVYAIASTIANAVLPQMQGDLSASLDQISWVVTASVVAGAIGIPPTPWLANRFGLKRVLIGSLTLFSLSAVMTGFSDSLAEVVFWRVSQSLFGAPIMALSQTVTLNSFPMEKRGNAMAVWTVALTTGWVFAPTMGAFLVEFDSWRLIFFILGPPALIAVILCVIFVPANESNRTLRFDWAGFATLAVCIIAFQMVFNRGQRLDWFASSEILLWTAAALISLYLYVVHTVTSSNSFIRWRCFRDRNLAIGIVITGIFGFLSLVPLVLIPTMLENLRGMELITIGLVILPRGIVQVFVTFAMGPLVNRIDPRLPIAAGFIIFAVSCAMMARYNLNIGPLDLLLPIALQGLAVAMIWMPTFHILYLTLEPELRTDGATLLGLVYSIVSSAGVALIVTLLSRSTQTNREELSLFITRQNELFSFPEYATWDLSARESLAGLHAEVGQQALMLGYINVWWFVMMVAIAAVPVVLLAKGKG